MKKVLIVLSFLLTILLSACNSGVKTATTDKAETEAILQETIEEEKAEDGKITIQTIHFTIKIPEKWKEICSYEVDDKMLSFSHKASDEYYREHSGFPGGHLFSINIADLSYYCDVEAEIIGGLSIPGEGEFNVWKVLASDVQSSEETHEEYWQCMEEIDEIVSTISFNKAYYFTKTPYQIEMESFASDPYVETGVYESEPQKEAINDTKLCSMAFDHFTMMALDVKNELIKAGHRTASASAVYPPNIVSRTEQLVTIEGKINYWLKGGNPTGSFKATVVYDKYSGAVVIDNIN